MIYPPISAKQTSAVQIYKSREDDPPGNKTTKICVTFQGGHIKHHKQYITLDVCFVNPIKNQPLCSSPRKVVN